MAEKIIKRTDATVKIEKGLTTIIGYFLTVFTKGKASGLAETTHLHFLCSHCGYPDEVEREFCSNCNKNTDGFAIEIVKPFQCKFCFTRQKEKFSFCPKCNKHANEVRPKS